MRSLLAILAIVFILACSRIFGPDHAGTVNEEETGVATIKGEVELASDSILLDGAIVKLRNSKKNQISPKDLREQTAGLYKTLKDDDTVRITTTENGTFHFDKVKPGHYFVEIHYEHRYGAIVERIVKEEDTLVDASCQLNRYGYLQGGLDTSFIQKTGITYVYFAELDSLILVKPDGNFELENAIPYDYTLIFVHDDKNIDSPLDTMVIDIKPEDTTSVKNIGAGTGIVEIKGEIEE